LKNYIVILVLPILNTKLHQNHITFNLKIQHWCTTTNQANYTRNRRTSNASPSKQKESITAINCAHVTH